MASSQKDHRWKRPLQYLISYIAFSFFIIEIVYYEILCPPFHQYVSIPLTCLSSPLLQEACNICDVILKESHRLALGLINDQSC